MHGDQTILTFLIKLCQYIVLNECDGKVEEKKKKKKTNNIIVMLITTLIINQRTTYKPGYG